jgi:hypothetical protein
VLKFSKLRNAYKPPKSLKELNVKDDLYILELVKILKTMEKVTQNKKGRKVQSLVEKSYSL